MSRYIDADKAVEMIKNYGKGAISDGYKSLDPVDDIVYLAQGIDMIPTADVAEVKHGEWIKDRNRRICSKCDFKYWANGGFLFNYCPNCGARMRGNQNE